MSSKISRTTRIRKKLMSNSTRPRLNVFRSSKRIYAQIIDDNKGTTLVSASEADLKEIKKSKIKRTKIDKATLVGELIASKAVKAKIKKVVFDRGPNKYHGRVKALAESAKNGGLIF